MKTDTCDTCGATYDYMQNYDCTSGCGMEFVGPCCMEVHRDCMNPANYMPNYEDDEPFFKDEF